MFIARSLMLDLLDREESPWITTWIGSFEFDLLDREESKNMNQTLDRNVDRFVLFAFDLLDQEESKLRITMWIGSS